MNIHQMSVQYDERQDRLSFRISNQEQQEFRLWLTRAMTLRLLPHLQAAVVQLEACDPKVSAVDTTAQQMLAELKRANFLSYADFSTPFSTQNLTLPLGESPVLVTDVQLNLHNNGSLELLLQDKSGENASGASCQLSLQAKLLHGLLHLLELALKKAQWQQPDFSHRPEALDSPQDRPFFSH
jgi:hypothetical protein